MTDTAGPPPDWAESWLKGQPDSKALFKSLAEVREWLKGLPDAETSLRNEPVAEVWLKSMPPDTERLINSLPDFAAWFEHWPDAGAWLREPEKLVRDINTLFDCLLELTDVEIEVGRYFSPKVKPRFGRALMPLTCMRCDEFVIQVMAANCIQPLPLSPERLRRVGEILKTWDDDDSDCESVTMSDGIVGTATKWEPRFSFDQQCELCREAVQILAGECRAAREYARLKSVLEKPRKSRQRRSCKPTDISEDDRRSIYGLLDELSQNPLTPIPSRDVLQKAKKKRSIKMENAKIGILLGEWKEEQKLKLIRPRRPRGTD